MLKSRVSIIKQITNTAFEYKGIYSILEYLNYFPYTNLSRFCKFNNPKRNQTILPTIKKILFCRMYVSQIAGCNPCSIWKGFNKTSQGELLKYPLLKKNMAIPKIIMITAVPFPLRVIVETRNARFPKNKAGNISCATMPRGLIG